MEGKQSFNKINTMRKGIIFSSIAFAIILSGCEKKKSDYEKFTNNDFSIEVPIKWEKDTAPFPVMPYVAFSDNQTVTVCTKMLEGVSIDSFANERIADYSANMIGFHLQDKVIEGDTATIYYYNDDEEDPTFHNETIFKIAKKGNMFYGASCSSNTKEEKDTVEHIISSFHLN